MSSTISASSAARKNLVEAHQRDRMGLRRVLRRERLHQRGERARDHARRRRSPSGQRGGRDVDDGARAEQAGDEEQRPRMALFHSGRATMVESRMPV